MGFWWNIFVRDLLENTFLVLLLSFGFQLNSGHICYYITDAQSGEKIVFTGKQSVIDLSGRKIQLIEGFFNISNFYYFMQQLKQDCD